MRPLPNNTMNTIGHTQRYTLEIFVQTLIEKQKRGYAQVTKLRQQIENVKLTTTTTGTDNDALV